MVVLQIVAIKIISMPEAPTICLNTPANKVYHRRRDGAWGAGRRYVRTY